MALRVYHEDYPTCITRDEWKANDLHIFDQEDLSDLADVEFAGLGNLHIIYYDLAAAKWKNRLLSSWDLSDLGTKVLNNLDNVNVPAPTDQYVLKYDDASGLWIASLVPAHKDRHDPNDGADKLDTAAAGTIQPDDSAAVGSAHSFARSDHKHAIVAAAPSDIGVANAEGDATSFARSNHVHNVAGQAGEGHIFLYPFAYSAINQGTWVVNVQASYLLNADMYNTTSADGDEVDFQAYLAAGTYTLLLIASKSTDRAIGDIDIDGGEVASFDLYNAIFVGNNLLRQAAIAVATSGLKTITYRAHGKNGASTDYVAAFQAIVLWRTA